MKRFFFHVVISMNKTTNGQHTAELLLELVVRRASGILISKPFTEFFEIYYQKSSYSHHTTTPPGGTTTATHTTNRLDGSTNGRIELFEKYLFDSRSTPTGIISCATI